MMKYILNKIFAGFNCMVAFVMIFALCCLDSESWWPTIVFFASAVYLVAAGYFYERSIAEGEEE